MKFNMTNILYFLGVGGGAKDAWDFWISGLVKKTDGTDM